MNKLRLVLVAALLCLVGYASAAVVTIRTRLPPNGDATLDLAYPADAKPPGASSVAWNDACLAAALAVIANRNTGTATSIDVGAQTCLGGTNAASATITLDASGSAANWSIVSAGSARNLTNAGVEGVANGSGVIVLRATYMGAFVLSSAPPNGTAYPWSYTTAPVSDTTPPHPITGTVATPTANTGELLITFDSTVDPSDGIEHSGVAVYHFYDGGVLIAGQDLTAVSPGMVNDFTCAARGTASGTGSVSGTQWTLSGNGGAGLESPDDNVNQCSFPFNGASMDIIAKISTIGNAATYDKVYLDALTSLDTNSVANNATLYRDINNALNTNARGRAVTGGNRGSQASAVVVNATIPAAMWLHLLYNASGATAEYSLDGGVWHQFLVNNTAAPMPLSKFASFGTTATSAGVSITSVFDYVTVNNVGRLTKVLTGLSAVPHTITVKAGDFAGNISTALAGSTATPTPPPLAALKYQPGWYALSHYSLIPYNGFFGQTLATILSQIDTEVCANSYIKGIKYIALPGFFEGPVAGDYAGATRTNGAANQGGFPWMDEILAKLNSCGKFLIITGDNAQYGGTGCGTGEGWACYFPGYMVTPARGGTDTNNIYDTRLFTGNRPGQGITLASWDSDVRDRAIAVAQAYCARYDGDPAFYGFANYYHSTNWILTNGTFPEAQAHIYYRDYVNAAQAACPHTNIVNVLDYANPYPAQMSTYIANIQTNHLTQGNTDTSPGTADQWGQRVYEGLAGSPTIIDYRGVIRFMPEIENPEMCSGGVGVWTPAQFVNKFENGVTSGGVFYPPWWPTHIIIDMATQCPAGYNWAAWKTYLSGTGGKVWNGHDGTLRTTEEVRTMWCESSMTCP